MSLSLRMTTRVRGASTTPRSKAMPTWASSDADTGFKWVDLENCLLHRTICPDAILIVRGHVMSCHMESQFKKCSHYIWLTYPILLPVYCSSTKNFADWRVVVNFHIILWLGVLLNLQSHISWICLFVSFHCWILKMWKMWIKQEGPDITYIWPSM